ncbi:MAG: tryptophan 2,3-dioxygenase [Flavobacteriia bacterium]|mgnify:CR=1 FL=1|nr:tryptophan 2,3-dioxygenase [Flavobacteriia bacterium]OJX39325.1 MAG: tryptophan 2,3-dioxygenase [Flavobacteriia bacterium 40-80]
MENPDLINDIRDKYKDLGENPDTYLNGLLYAKPLNYWDYIQRDALLNLQHPRTDFEDEEIFIIYHQITELILKLIMNEVKQIHKQETLTEEFLLVKIKRINRYTAMLVNSFDIMGKGMDYDDYNKFRLTLAPASGFQAVSFRYLEFYITGIENLVNERGRARLPENPVLEDYFRNLYWKDAGYDHKTGNKTLTLRQFEEKYAEELLTLAKKMQGQTLDLKIARMGELSPELKRELRLFDQLYNIHWPLVHINTARTYLDAKGENKAATGGSEWKKYLHPAFQRRKFFPQLWSAEELENWAKEFLDY